MKKVVLVLLAVVAISVSSCQKENQAGQTTPVAPTKGLSITKNLLAVSKNKKDTVPPSATFTRLRDTVPPSKTVKDTVPPSFK